MDAYRYGEIAFVQIQTLCSSTLAATKIPFGGFGQNKCTVIVRRLHHIQRPRFRDYL
jgi:hypothetical protein